MSSLTGNTLEVNCFGSGFSISEVYCEVCDSYFWIETVKIIKSLNPNTSVIQFIVCPHGCGDISL